MKSKIIFSLLAFLLVVFILLLLFIPDNKPFKIISSPKIYSIYKSSDNEHFEVQFLVNKKDTYYFSTEYISSISLNSYLDEEIIPISIKEITYNSGQYIYESEEYYLVELKLIMGFNSEDYLIDFDKTFLNLEYSNSEELKLYIGEFNYIFDSELNTEISVNNLSSTVSKLNGINTVTGVFVELNNISEENLILNSFSLGSNSLKFNSFYLTEIYTKPDLFDEVKDILLIDSYNFSIFNNEVDQSILLRENQSIMLYIPLSYIGDINYIHRFYFEVLYENNFGNNRIIIDDFPYISTSNFSECLEEGYILYEIPN